MTTVSHPPKKGYRTIRLPLGESEYDRFLSDRTYAQARLQELYEEAPELFPEAFGWGYAFFGYTDLSCKQQVRCRRIRLEENGVVFTVAPTFVMPYMTGRTHEVETALFLMRFHVPCWAIAYAFGRDAMYWYRLQQGLGRLSLVGTTVKTAAHVPKDLVADEKHSWLQGQRVYIATTAGRDCILGASVSTSASQRDLHQAYGIFAGEAQSVEKDYAPETVNTDGWPATQGAWKALFPNITVILCFLHAFLKIRDRATQALGTVFAPIQERVWEAYHALDINVATRAIIGSYVPCCTVHTQNDPTTWRLSLCLDTTAAVGHGSTRRPRRPHPSCHRLRHDTHNDLSPPRSLVNTRIYTHGRSICVRARTTVYNPA
jgi:hypothetical protein